MSDMNEVRPEVSALMYHWFGKISPPLFVVLSAIYLNASTSSDCLASSTIQEMATKTGLGWRTVQVKLHELADMGAIQILSVAKQRMRVQIPEYYWLIQMDRSDEPGVPLPADSPPTQVAPKSIADLVIALCGEQPSSEMLAFMQTVADRDELRLRCCLENFLEQGKRWEKVNLLAVAVRNDLRPDGYFDDYWAGNDGRSAGGWV
jgi:hypothetical protein